MSDNSIAPKPLSDSAARDAALDPRRSVVVTAPAGSGKTELLTLRILVLLAQVDEPEDILAITFTRKAAAEMRERVLRYLRWEPDAKGKFPADYVKPLVDAVIEKNQQSQWNLLLNPQRLRIQTIDSFTGSLIANLPLQSGFGGRPTVQEDAYSLYRDAVNQLLNALESDTTLTDSLGKLLLHVDNRFATLEDLLVTLLAKRDQWLLLLGTGRNVQQARDYFQSTLRDLIETHLQLAYEKLSPLGGDLMSLVDYACQQLKSLNPGSPLLAIRDIGGLPDIDADQLEQWRLLYQFLFTGKGELRKRITKTEGFPTDKKDVQDVAYGKQQKQAMLDLLEEIKARPELIEALQAIDYLPAAQYSDQQWQILSALVVVLPRLLAELQLVFARRAEVDFTEQSLASLRALGELDDVSELRFNVDQRLKHILVDEFQDTSVVQFNLLKSLVAEWEHHNLANPQAPRTLFVVGDGMQSIYGFRAADVGLFLDAREQGIGAVQLDALDLTVNFRSSPVIVNWVNEVFSRLFPSEDNPDLGASHHVRAEAIKTTVGEVRLSGFVDDHKNVKQTRYCVELIKQLQATQTGSTIAVLVRAKAHLHDLIEQLTQAGIAWQATDIAPLVGRPVVQDLWMLLRALANPADRIAWLALLRSPLCGLDNSDLFALIAKPAMTSTEFSEDDESRYRSLQPITQRLLNNEVVKALSQQGQLLATRLADVLRAAENVRERKPLRTWLESVWLSLGGARAYEGFVAGDNPWQEAEAFFALLENKLPHLSDFDSIVFEESISKLFVTPQVNNDRATVQLMTMHKAKGLEFDSVILPYLDRTTKSDDKPLLMWDSYHSHDNDFSHNSCEPQLLLAVKPARGGDTDSIYDYLRHKRAQRSALEQVRLLYVAATRAKANLYLSYGGKTNDKGERLPPASTSLLARLYPAFETGELAESWNQGWKQQSSTPLTNTTGTPDRIEKAANTLLQLQPEWRVCSTDIHMPIGEAPDCQDNISAKAVGNVVHKTLEIIASHSNAFWEGLNYQEQRNWLSRLLEQQLPQALIAEAMVTVQKHIQAVLADKTGRWILDSSRQQSKVEWPLFFKPDIERPNRDSLSQVVIDRCFIADGICWLIDYKTAEPQAGEALDDFLAREEKVYAPQLLHYSQLLTALWNLPVKAGLYFTALPHWHELNL